MKNTFYSMNDDIISRMRRKRGLDRATAARLLCCGGTDIASFEGGLRRPNLATQRLAQLIHDHAIVMDWCRELTAERQLNLAEQYLTKVRRGK